MANIASVRLKDTPLILVTNFLAGVNTFMTGKPAIGKSMSIEDFAAKMRQRMPEFQLWRFYAPTMSPMDIMASAPDYEKGTLNNYCNAALPNAYATPDAKGAIFIGEMGNTDPATLKLLQKYVNGEDMSGVLRKPDGVIVIADGNRLEDKSGTVQQGRAYLSRFEQFEVFTTAEDNIEHAAKHSWHPTVQTFFRDNPACIDNYDAVFGFDADAQVGGNQSSHQLATEEGKRGIWANMRAWERVSKKMYAAESMQRAGGVTQSEFAGNVGTAVASQFAAHCHIINNLVSFEAMMADPDNVALPSKMDEQYMLSMIIALRAKSEQMPAVRKVGERFPLEMQALILRTMSQRKGFNLAATQDYLLWIKNKELTALLNGR